MKLRARNWDRVLKDYNIGWAENQRQACANNLGTLSSLSHTLSSAAKGGRKFTMKDVLRCAEEIYGERYSCPDGGHYTLDADGKRVACEHHGLLTEPRQLAAPSTKTRAGRLMKKFGGVTATITLTKEGLRAVLSIEYDRKQ